MWFKNKRSSLWFSLQVLIYTVVGTAISTKYFLELIIVLAVLVM